jgi:predicted 3-demethylubiquinone-9 3-methyltransferase (glyoxalase superfamily)
MKKISPFLWFDGKAEAAVEFYTTVFPDAEIVRIARYGKGGPGPVGTVMTVHFRLFGQDFTAMNGGPVYPLTPGISFVIRCATQKEVDYYWKKLGAGAEMQQCGWLTDKFGVTWQVVPDVLMELVSDKDAEKVARVMAAMMKMTKLNIKRLERAAAKKA